MLANQMPANLAITSRFFAVFMFFTSLTAIMPQAASALEIKGHFIDAARLDTLYFEADSDADGFEIGNRRLLYRPDGAPAGANGLIAAIPAGELNSYGYTYFIERCRNPDTGLDQLMFSRANGGTADGDRSNALFVYYDKSAQHYVASDIDAQFVDNSCSLKTAEAHRRHAEGLDAQADAIYRALRPPHINTRIFSAKKLSDFRLEPFVKQIEAFNRSEEDYEFWKGASEYREARHFYAQKLVENDGWLLLSVYYEGTLDSSRGVLLARNKKTGIWRSIYDMPQGDSSKVNVYRPGEMQLQGDSLLLDVCTDCSWWGKYASFRLNLHTLAYQRLPTSGM